MPLKMKALKCKTLGASVMYVETLYIANKIYRRKYTMYMYMHMRTNACVYGDVYVHVYNIYNIDAYADKCVSLREVYGNLAKTKALSSSSLLPTAWPTVTLLSSFRNFRPRKSEQMFAAVPPNATLVSEY